MVELPPPRKLGAPEVFVVVAVLAVALPFTAWWRGLYEPQVISSPFPQKVQIHPEAIPQTAGLPTEPLSVVGYMARPTLEGGTYVFPAGKPAVLTFKLGSPPLTDPNQALLLVVGVIGLVAGVLYSFAIYPTLRR